MNARVAEAAHWVLRHAASFLCLGAREHLAAAAGLVGPVEKCTAVAWTLEVG